MGLTRLILAGNIVIVLALLAQTFLFLEWKIDIIFTENDHLVWACFEMIEIVFLCALIPEFLNKQLDFLRGKMGIFVGILSLIRFAVIN